MGLCIIAGGSGAGKTEYIYRKIIELSAKEPEGRFFVVTPEQATMQAQKEIVRLHPNHGTLNIDIVSFERLAYRIFSELSLPQPEVLDDTGKNMVLRKLAGEKMDELTIGILSFAYTFSTFEVVTVVFLIAMMIFMGVRKIPVLVFVPIGTTLFLSLAFRTFLHVLLP